MTGGRWPTPRRIRAAQPERGRGGTQHSPLGAVAHRARALAGTLRGERPTEEALRARAADFSEEKAADAYLALFEKLVRGRVR